MTDSSNMRTGGQLLVDALALHGADMAFCVPGESYLAALDALHDTPSIRLITCRQEGGAAMMAETYGKMTGRPGIAFVTRGPGATNATAGLHIALQDSTPMILLIGQVARDQFDREAFQEIDYRRMLEQVTKWTAQIEDPSRVGEYVSRAFHVATSGRPGPVALALPEDMLTELAAADLGEAYQTPEIAPTPGDMEKLESMLANASNPLMLVGGSRWSAETGEKIADFAERNGLPLASSFRCQDYVDNLAPCYAGHVGIGPEASLADRVRNADMLIVLGARIGEMTSSGYSLLDIPRPKQKLVHIHSGADELGTVYQADLPIVATPAAFADAVAGIDCRDSRADMDAAHQAFIQFTRPGSIPGDLQLAEIIGGISDNLPPETIFTNGAGNYAIWVQRYRRFRQFRTQLAPTSGSMGYGVPSGVAAKLMYPDRPVISFSGDGCFMMHGQELATAIQHDAAVIFVVVNNGKFGTIRMHQEREYTGRVIGTELVNPDFAALARAYGANGEVVEKTEDFAPALERAMASNKASLIELRIDPDVLSPAATISGMRKAAGK